MLVGRCRCHTALLPVTRPTTASRRAPSQGAWGNRIIGAAPAEVRAASSSTFRGLPDGARLTEALYWRRRALEPFRDLFCRPVRAEGAP